MLIDKIIQAKKSTSFFFSKLFLNSVIKINMPYISGTYSTFASRLHQLPLTSGDLNNFALEASGYSQYLKTGEKAKINQEFAKRYYTNFKDSNYYNNPKIK